MEWIAAISEATPLALGFVMLVAIIVLLSTGKLYVPAQVNSLLVQADKLLDIQSERIREANDRADDYKSAWVGAEARNDVLVDYLKQLGVIVPKVVEHLTAERENS